VTLVEASSRRLTAASRRTQESIDAADSSVQHPLLSEAGSMEEKEKERRGVANAAREAKNDKKPCEKETVKLMGRRVGELDAPIYTRSTTTTDTTTLLNLSRRDR
jgi:hypothetical protein